MCKLHTKHLSKILKKNMEKMAKKQVRKYFMENLFVSIKIAT